jgi:hypothetical protein
MPSTVLMASVVATLGGLAAQVIARIRLICKPDKDGHCRVASGCTDSKLDDHHEIDCQEYEVGGKTILIIASKE